MFDDLYSVFSKAEEEISKLCSLTDLENLRIRYLGKSGFLTNELKKISSIKDESSRKVFGSKLNEACRKLRLSIDEKRKSLIEKELNEKLALQKVDLSLPVRYKKVGKLHVLSKVISEVKNIFSSIGFELASGPEIEDEFHVFDALNTPSHHPARRSQDTFYITFNNIRFLLRTHTSSVQIRTMEKDNTPPIKIMAPGRVYRNDWDSTHTPMFHQIEGLYIDSHVNMGHLKYCINYFLKKFFDKEVKTRFRASFFPFTEPSMEVDILCTHSNKWLEILGCGLVHPKVLENVNIDSTKYSGFAFGIGLERIAMLKYKINDLREFYNSDINWLQHYGFSFHELRTI